MCLYNVQQVYSLLCNVLPLQAKSHQHLPSYTRTHTCTQYSGYKYEIIVIDDNSPDGTLQVAKELQRLYGEEKIVSTRTVLHCILTIEDRVIGCVLSADNPPMELLDNEHKLTVPLFPLVRLRC